MNITPLCISFMGNLSGRDSLEFISYNYDMLINFFKSNELLTLLSSKKTQNLGSALDSVDSNLNDLIFSDQIKKIFRF